MKFPTEKHLQDFQGDKFGYTDLSRKILDEILLEMELPNCFGLYGNWGSGKSTILHFVQEHLREEKYKGIIPVYFEAWQYEYAEQKDLLFALLNCIKEKSGTNRTLFQRLQVDAAAIAVGVPDLLAGGKLGDFVGRVGSNLSKFEQRLLKEHKRWVDRIKEFKVEFSSVIKKALTKNNASKLFIFVDDLDRCLPENAVKLLEGIKNFLSVENICFILAIDRRVVGEMIEKKYGLHDGYGDEYLMKIVHYYYELPTVSLKEAVASILATHDLKPTERQTAYIVNFLHEEAREPRKAKHIVHQFCMAVLLSREGRKELETDSTETKLQYAFVASYLLTMFSSTFSLGNPLELLKNVRESAQAKHGNDHGTDAHREILEKYKIEPLTRKKLEATLGHRIVPRNVEQGSIDVDTLYNMMRMLKGA